MRTLPIEESHELIRGSVKLGGDKTMLVMKGSLSTIERQVEYRLHQAYSPGSKTSAILPVSHDTTKP
jgi:hypothetical protein